MSGDEVRNHWYMFWADGVSNIDLFMLMMMVVLFLSLFLLIWYWGIPALHKRLTAPPVRSTQPTSETSNDSTDEDDVVVSMGGVVLRGNS